MTKGVFTNLSFRAGTSNTEQGVEDKFATIARPKLRFNFTVTFKFRDPILMGTEDNKSENGTMFDEVTFALKQAARPNPTVQYQDVNFYNYRTKVATKVDYGTVQLTLYDDVQNNGHDLFESYLKRISPIANVIKERAGLLKEESRPSRNFRYNASRFFDGGTGSLGPLSPADGGEYGLLENITIRHWFFSQTERRSPQTGQVETDQVGRASDGENTLNPENVQYVEYQFLNPKIINMTFDELDMSQSEASTIMANFNYDSVFIDSPKSSADPVPTQTGTRGDTFTLDDLRARKLDIQRLIRRIKRLDTLPDISVLQTVGGFIPPITGNLPNIQIPKPEVDLPTIDII